MAEHLGFKGQCPPPPPWKVCSLALGLGSQGLGFRALVAAKGGIGP